MERTGERYSTARAVLRGRARTNVARSPVVTVPVEDLPRAIAFYRDALGFSLLGESNDGAWAEVGNEDITLGLHAGGTIGTDTGVGLRVSDLASTCRMIVEGGGAVDHDPAQATVVTVRDPDRNTIRIMQLS